MRWGIRYVRTLLVLLIALAASGCAAVDGKKVAGGSKAATGNKEEPCHAIIDWVDFLMIQDRKYYYNREGAGGGTAVQPGDPIGEVSYMLDGHACTVHESKNGDAAYLPVGTDIYEMKGYRSDFRVVAGNKVYEIKENPYAKTMGDLLDIAGKVAKVSLESAEDGSPIGDFSAEASSQFIRQLLPLPYVGFDAVYEKTKHESGIFLRVHLQDGTSLRMVYYPKGNALAAGAFAAESLKELILTQRDRIKAAAGL